MKEVWKSVKDYEGYVSVSNLGRIRTETRTVAHARHGTATYKGHLIPPSDTVTLSKNHSGQSFSLARLVAIAFVSNPDNLPVVIHADGNNSNCRASNLLWVTDSAVVQRSYDSGRARLTGESHPSAILTEENVRTIRKLLKSQSGVSQAELARRFGVCPQVVTDIKMGRSWAHIK